MTGTAKSTKTSGLKLQPIRLQAFELTKPMRVCQVYASRSKSSLRVRPAADGGAIPFNTQFFHDDYDDGPAFDDVFEGDVASGPVTPPEDQDLLAATQGQGRRIRPEFVNYAKRAKRVDVRKLKDNIWKGLNITVNGALQDGEDKIMVCHHQCSHL